ncbi:excinuclease ABC subunit UvrC [Edaphobacter albus]|uniref:excinuclease ABC subunit C n=1 Tax=Edaphobacter sp. 4G125 TaxID=2763071 RepID=UPI001646AC3E|nr:excinuclease ABC subunit C [Edaphobacter sp. 4G125]QNI36414.1 excinuclease ABC subunit C [Edaphobacter sp. 4G125]
MAAEFQFDKNLAFSAENADEVLRSVPALPGVFALYGKQEGSEPYLTRAADIRRRMKRLLAPPESQSKRLNLRDRVARIEYTVTGSEFESTLTLYHASATIFGYAEARRRLRLHTPAFLRIAMENEFPRVYVTNRLSKRGLSETYGPFPSRASAERYCDAVLDLFKLRRCHEDLQPYPEHPGCVYGEMKKCLEPCKQACTTEQYAAEAEAVKAFFDTHGGSMLSRIAEQREKASEEMEFEHAAELHEQHQKVKNAASLADEIVQPVPKLRAIVAQRAASMEEHEDEAALFLLAAGCVVGPERLSTLGVRAVKEQTSVGSSLFAQPLMLAAVLLDETTSTEPTNSPEDRARAALADLEEHVSANHDLALLSDHLSLFRRWYYRPEKQRVGESFLPNPDGDWPIRRILNGAARQVLGNPKQVPDVQRETAKKMRVLHKGRPDVEREVPVVDRND